MMVLLYCSIQALSAEWPLTSNYPFVQQLKLCSKLAHLRPAQFYLNPGDNLAWNTLFMEHKADSQQSNVEIYQVSCNQHYISALQIMQSALAMSINYDDVVLAKYLVLALLHVVSLI